MRSIKRRLLVSILSVIFLSTVISVGTTYFELKNEMDELFDENMKQIAHAIAVHDITEQSEFISEEKSIPRTLKGEEEFLIQVWENDRLSFSSIPSIDFPRQAAGGTQTVLHHQEKWRYYALAVRDGWLIQVSQPIPMRHTVIWEIYSEQLIPTLIQLPVLAVLIWLFVGYGFLPLERISESIEKRTSVFLEKLPDDDIPKEINKMVLAINGLLDRLSLALESQRRFTADAAHELRTPLTAVRLELDILKKADTAEEREQSLDKLYQAVDRSSHMVHQLLEMAHLDPDSENKSFEIIELKQLIDNLVCGIRSLSDGKSIDIRIKSFDHITVDGHAHALATMIGNVINNAVQYTPKGGRIEISARVDGRHVILKVSDNGVGIPEGERTRIFDRFYRVLGSNHSAVVGSGLGLSIVKSIAESHGASIQISQGLDGKGTSFEFYFPTKMTS